MCMHYASAILNSPACFVHYIQCTQTYTYSYTQHPTTFRMPPSFRYIAISNCVNEWKPNFACMVVLYCTVLFARKQMNQHRF